MIEEFPIEDSDPQTGDNTDTVLWTIMATVALLIIVWFVRRKKKVTQKIN